MGTISQAPRFSIITCTLNSMPWLDACIASVLNQREISYELVFVDGGSTDGSLERISALSDGRHPLTVLRDIGGGVARAMNAGLAVARGDIVAYLHADDFYLRDDVLATVAQAFEASGCHWLFGRTLRALGERLEPEGWRAPRYSRKQLLRGNFIPHPATFVERLLMQQAGGFNPRWRYAMDYDLWLRLSLIAAPLQLDQPLTAFREHEGSLSTRERGRAMREDLRVRLAHAGPNPLDYPGHLARHVIRHMIRAPWRRWRDHPSDTGDAHA
jgi:glycosyltransferase involved in cell wall biosynthesis